MTHVKLTDHAICRYSDRVKPGLPLSAAKHELEALTNQGELRATLDWQDPDLDTDAYLLLSDGIALALRFAGATSTKSWIATTTLTRAGTSPERREARRQRRKKRQAWRQALAENKKGKLGRKKKLALQREAA